MNEAHGGNDWIVLTAAYGPIRPGYFQRVPSAPVGADDLYSVYAAMRDDRRGSIIGYYPDKASALSAAKHVLNKFCDFVITDDKPSLANKANWRYPKSLYYTIRDQAYFVDVLNLGEANRKLAQAGQVTSGRYVPDADCEKQLFELAQGRADEFKQEKIASSKWESAMKIKVKESGYTDASKVYNALEDGNYFTGEELVLVTDGWGLNTDTLDRICQVRYGMDADQLLAESASEKKQEDAPWQPTMKRIRDLKKDEYFTLRPVEEPKESQVWVMDGYDRGERKWYAYKFADVNDGRYFSGDKEVCTGFTF